jgi:hypothetical protein
VKSVLTAAGNLARKQQRRALGRARWAVRVTDEGVRDASHATRRAGEGIRDRVINLLKDAFRRARRPIRAASRRRAQAAEQRGFDRVEWDVTRELEAVAAGDRPIVVGPWLSEVGFETLYWVPFLHWFMAAFRIDPARIVVVSRGGAGCWYEGLLGPSTPIGPGNYVEIWDDLDPDEFARRNAARGVTKQYEPSDLDRDVLASVARRIGTAEFSVLHPGLMYRLFTLYWSGHRPMGFVDKYLRFTRLPPPQVIDPALLPAEYVAVKFYAARSLPDTPEIRAQLRAIVRRLAERTPVVLLDTGLVLDEHADYEFTRDGRVISARGWMTPRNNLAVQTQIVAGAKAFVGTCGSIAWLAPRLGVDTSGLYVDPKWLHAHLAVAMRAYHKLGAGRFAVADLRALDPLGSFGMWGPPSGGPPPVYAGAPPHE